jgi:hypothetical protein
MIDGNARLRKLRSFHRFHWQRLQHAKLGGATSGCFWLGSSMPFRSSEVASPSICQIALHDLLEFAPKGLHHRQHPVVSVPLHRSPCLCPHPSLDSTWFSHGLYPYHQLANHQSVSICTKSAFTNSGWCSRHITTKEIARLFDAPVAVELRIHHHHHSSPIPSYHPLLTSVPAKVLQHALWLTGHLKVQLKGDIDDINDMNSAHYASNNNTFPSNDLFHPKFELHPDTGLLRSHEDFVKFSTNLNSKENSKVDVKAAKGDDARIPVELWNKRLIKNHPFSDQIPSLSDEKLNDHLTFIRQLALKRWKINVRKSFIKYLNMNWSEQYAKYLKGSRSNNLDSEFEKDLIAGRECLSYVMECNWWEWSAGSRLLFWRWSPEFRKHARDGIPVLWLPDKKPTNKKPQPEVHDPIVKRSMKSKLNKVRKRGYVQQGFVKSLIRFFAVPKGDSDIRMVYDGTASGFNDSVWVPSFGLPTIDTLLRGTSSESWMVDLDIGDMFLNFMLDEDAREMVGIDLTPFFPEELHEDVRILWEYWVRCAMGLKVSPNHAIRAMLFAEEYLKGMPKDLKNPFEYASVRLNLPGSENYDPSLPWYSVLDFKGLLAALLATYVDDERVNANSEERAWQAAHQIGSRESYLGIQDAARKRRPPSQRNAGAWAGSIIRTNDSEVGITVSQERWSKTKSIIGKWLDRICKNPDQGLNTKELLSDRGFLIYITRTFKMMVPYLKGFHLTIDGWRTDRDSDGWKVATAYVHKESSVHSQDSFLNSSNYPDLVKPVPRFKSDLEALTSLVSSSTPPVLITQTKRIYIARYGFGDASGGGFGSSIEFDGKIEIMMGTWNDEGSKKSSNFRELANFVILLENEASSGRLKGSELFLFTDNDTAQSAYHNGTSSSKTLFNLILRIRSLELSEGIKVHLIHVAGTRMIQQGTDGISRGNLLEGVMTGRKMISFVPISLGAVERSPKLLQWFRSWTNDFELKPLTPKEWLWEGQGLGNDTWENCDNVKFPKRSERRMFLWAPAPSIADVAIELLRTSIHRRTDALHIFVCPKLMVYKWRKTLLRSCSLSFYVDVGPDHWPQDMHESLLIAVFLPLLHCPPWTYRRSRSVLALERQLFQVQKTKDGTQSDLLRKFLLFTRRLSSMSESLVWNLLHQGRTR